MESLNQDSDTDTGDPSPRSQKPQSDQSSESLAHPIDTTDEAVSVNESGKIASCLIFRFVFLIIGSTAPVYRSRITPAKFYTEIYQHQCDRTIMCDEQFMAMNMQNCGHKICANCSYVLHAHPSLIN